MKKNFFVIFSSLMALSLLAAEPKFRPEKWASPVVSENPGNWYKLNDKVYRSAQPDRKGFEAIEKSGIKNVLNLGDKDADQKSARGFGLKLYLVEMKADEIKVGQVIKALRIIKDAEGPILIHCWHGADRTGVICAMYRIIFQNWTKEEAIDEMINGGYGYHKIYTNIPRFIQNANINEMKKKIFAPRQSAATKTAIATGTGFASLLLANAFLFFNIFISVRLYPFTASGLISTRGGNTSPARS